MIVASGPWSISQIEQYLTATVVPVRLAYTAAGGWPAVQSLWYAYEDDALWCATQGNAKVVTHLNSDSRCSFEIAPNEPPYRGVRGRGRAHIDSGRGPAVLRMLIGRYLGTDTPALARWLLGRIDREVAIRISDLRVSSWDYTARMTRP